MGFNVHQSLEGRPFGKHDPFQQVKLALNFFQEWFSGFYNKFLSWKMRNHPLGRRTTCSENIFLCHATKGDLFSTVISIYGHQMFSGIRKSKNIFFQLNFRKSDIFRK